MTLIGGSIIPDPVILQSQVTDGWSVRKLAEHYGYKGSGSIWYWIEKYGTSVPADRVHKKYPPVPDESTLRSLVEDGWTANQIVDRYGCSKRSLYVIYQKLGIHPAKANDDIKDVLPTPEQDQIIRGTLMGDGSIRKAGNILAMAHGPDQVEYLRWKARKLYPYFRSDEPKSCSSLNHQVNKTYPGYYNYSVTHPVFGMYRKLMYPNGSKVVTEEILNGLDPLGLAVWYMDDGTLPSTNATLCTDSFSLQEHELMVAWFESKFGLNVNINRHTNHHRLVFTASATKDLSDLLRPYMLPDFYYKIVHTS